MALERRQVAGSAWSTVPTQADAEASVGGTARVLGPFPFAFDDPGLEDGIAFYTPNVGDVLLDAWIEVTEAFDGTTPFCDIGPLQPSDGGYGYFGNAMQPWDMSIADTVQIAGLLNTVVARASAMAQLSALSHPVNQSPLWFERTVPARITTAYPQKVWVTQTGVAGDAAVGGSTGVGAVYLVIATPSLT